MATKAQHNQQPSFKLTSVTTAQDLDSLYETNALTIEGFPMDEDEIMRMVAYFSECLADPSKPVEVLLIMGEVMDEVYGLTGSNRYPKDLNILSIPLNEFSEEGIGRLAMLRFDYGASWYRDIVDNNGKLKGYLR